MPRRLGIETQVADLSALAFTDLRDVTTETLDQTEERIKSQIERPRTNLGSSGPPGRTD